MGPVRGFRIFYDSPNAAFIAGETVSGYVSFSVLAHQLSTRGIQVTFKGYANVHWTEQETRTNENGESEIFDEHFTNNEDYFESKIWAFGNGSCTNLRRGDYSFPFRFLLPDAIPSSFEGEYGGVRYYAKARFELSSHANINFKSFFTVNSILDLNQNSVAKEKGHQMDHKTLCCLFCRSGPISALMETNKQGFVPGEKIVVDADIDNKSNRKMGKTQLRLMQKLTFASTRKNKTIENILSAFNGPAIDVGDSDGWRNFHVRVPAVPPSRLIYCSIIDIKYWLELHVEPSGPSFDLILRQPLVIGTVPLMDTFSSFEHPVQSQIVAYPPPDSRLVGSPPPMPGPQPYPDASGHVMPYPAQGISHPNSAVPPPQAGAPAPTHIVPSAPPLQFLNQYPNMPPPSYAQAVGNAKTRMSHGEDMDNTEGNWEYVPQYLVYNFSN